LRSYWEYVQDSVIHYHNVSFEELEGFLSTLLQYLSRSCSYYAPKQFLDRFPDATKALLSLNVITEDRGQIQFTHQQYHDYLIAREQYNCILLDNSFILTWLGDLQAQSFLKRERLRVILFMLEVVPEELVAVSKVLIYSEEVRFHLNTWCLK